MKIKELIVETAPEGKMHDHHVAVQKGVSRARDTGGYDRIYHMNRIGMAVAMAHGQDTKKIDGVDASSWVEKYNTTHPYTKEEDNMMQAAYNTVPSDHKRVTPWSKSSEPEDTHKHSPTPNWMKKSKK
jgi:hypothetical protein